MALSAVQGPPMPESLQAANFTMSAKATNGLWPLSAIARPPTIMATSSASSSASAL